MTASLSIKDQLLALPALRGLAKEVAYKTGEAIFKEGSEDHRFYIIEEGKVFIKKRNDEGVDRVISELRPGEFFGENVLLGQTHKMASAEAAEDVKLLTISYEDFDQLIHNDSQAGVDFLLRVLEVVGARLNYSNKQILELHTMNKLMHLYRDDIANLARAVVERMQAITESDAGAVFLHNSYSKAYRTVYSIGDLDETILQKIDGLASKITTQEGFHYLVADLGKSGTVVFSKNVQKESYTDDQLRLLILVAEQLAHTLETAAQNATEKAQQMLHQKRFSI